MKRRNRNGSQDSSKCPIGDGNLCPNKQSPKGNFDTNRFCSDLKQTIGNLQTRNSVDDRDKLAVLLNIMCEEIEAKNNKLDTALRKERRTAKKFDGLM